MVLSSFGGNGVKKVTILGDIMVEPPFMQQVEQNGQYDFKPSFAPLKTILKESDYVIGNLETPLAGPESGYTHELVSFNSPDVLVEALVDIGIDAVSTANNHSLDRGYEGLVRTLEVLDRYSIAHTGTYPEDFQGERIHYFTVGDTKLALIAGTFSTNFGINRVDLVGKRARCVNMLHPVHSGGAIYLPLPPAYAKTLAYVESLMGRKLVWEESTKLKRAMDMPRCSIDDTIPVEAFERCWTWVAEDYAEARKHADVVLFYPHSGGQFNVEPGKYTRYMVQRAIELGFDGVFAGHAHTTQRAEYLDRKPCFYSLGNVSMSPGTFYSIPECLPEYGLAVHLFTEKQQIQKVTFSIFKMVQEEALPMKVVPVVDLYAAAAEAERESLLSHVAEVYGRVTGKAHTWKTPQKEYEL